MKTYLFLICLLLTTACSKNKEKTANVIKIDLTIPADSVFYLSQLADSILYYPISWKNWEGNYYVNKTLTGYIGVNLTPDYIWCYTQTGKLYSRKDGKLVHTISFPFGSYNIFPQLQKSNVGSTTDDNVVDVECGYMSYYCLSIRMSTGEHVDSVSLPNRDYYRIKGTTLISLPKDFDTKVKWYNGKSELLKEQVLPDTVFDHGYGHRVPFCFLNDKAYAHFRGTNTIYEISPDMNLTPRYQYLLGDRMPEYAKLRGLSPKELDALPYCYLSNSKLTEDYIFGNYAYKSYLYRFLFNRSTRQTWVIPTGVYRSEGNSATKGIVNDLDGGMDFWPRSVSRAGEIYCIYKTEALREKVNQADPSKMKRPEAVARLKQMLNNLPEEMNLVVAILKEKKL